MSEITRGRGRPKVMDGKRHRQLYFSGRPDVYELFKYVCKLHRVDPNYAIEKLFRQYIEANGNVEALEKLRPFIKEDIAELAAEQDYILNQINADN